MLVSRNCPPPMLAEPSTVPGAPPTGSFASVLKLQRCKSACADESTVSIAFVLKSVYGTPFRLFETRQLNCAPLPASVVFVMVKEALVAPAMGTPLLIH